MALLESRVVGAKPRFECRAYEFVDEVRGVLIEAVDGGVLIGSHRRVLSLLRLEEGRGGPMTVFGGQRAEAWHEDGQYERDDGARFNFNFTLVESGGWADVVAYHYNVAWRPSDGVCGRDYLRFDWDEGFRGTRVLLGSPPLSHVHLGRHGIVSPTPVMSPLELLDLLLWHTLVSRPTPLSGGCSD